MHQFYFSQEGLSQNHGWGTTSKEETRCSWDNNIKMWQEGADNRVDLIGSELGPVAVLGELLALIESKDISSPAE
jgi:hypothetical protein